jgi:four helix bundle protein
VVRARKKPTGRWGGRTPHDHDHDHDHVHDLHVHVHDHVHAHEPERQLGEEAAEDLGMMNFQKLDVYRCAVQLLATAIKLETDMPRGMGKLKDQLRRAALSIPLNIAEGCGRDGQDSLQHFRIARGSTMEVAAVIDALSLLNVGTPETRAQALDLSERTIAMLTKMVHRTQSP